MNSSKISTIQPRFYYCILFLLIPFHFYIFLFVIFAITMKDCFVKCVNKNARLPLCMCFCCCRIDGHMNDDPIFHFVLVVVFSPPFCFAHTKQNQRNRNIKMPCDVCIWMIFVWSVFCAICWHFSHQNDKHSHFHPSNLF